MSAVVESLSGKGLSSITSGEWFLIGWLYAVYEINDPGSSYYTKENYLQVGHDTGLTYTLDFSRVASFKFWVPNRWGSNAPILHVFKMTSTGSQHLISGWAGDISLTSISDRTNLAIQAYIDEGGATVRCASFTTIDGVTHSLDALNY